MLTPDFQNLVLYSDTALEDMVLFHEKLRDIEASIEGVLYPYIHTYKEVQLGGGAIFPALAFVNGWTLQFPPGNFVISGGNLAATINPVAGCYIFQTQAGAYAVTTSGATGISDTDKQDISDKVWLHNNKTIKGSEESTLSSTEKTQLSETHAKAGTLDNNTKLQVITAISEIGYTNDIVNNQIVQLDKNGVEIARFNCLDSNGQPSLTNIKTMVLA